MMTTFVIQKNRSQKQTGFNPVFLATYLTWLQADRPNHHGIKLAYRRSPLASMAGIWFCRRKIDRET
jgi:hypothetical protein